MQAKKIVGGTVVTVPLNSLRMQPESWEALGPADELTYYERLGLVTTWGRYLAEIESRSVLLASKIAGGPGTMLEIGADGGRWSSALMNQGWKVICTDIRPDSLEVCQRRLPRAKCILVKPTDASLPCAANTINLILCLEVDPVSSSEWFMNEVWRVLTTGGILVATINNKFSLRSVFHAAFRPNEAKRRKDLGFYQVSYRECRRRLLQSGFKLIHEEGCCWPPFTRESNSSLIPFFAGLEKYSGLRRLTSLSPWVVFVARK